MLSTPTFGADVLEGHIAVTGKEPSSTWLLSQSGAEQIRKITPNGTVMTVSGGFPPPSWLYPSTIAVDITGSVYVPDYGGLVIRQITASGSQSILAGRKNWVVFLLLPPLQQKPRLNHMFAPHSEESRFPSNLPVATKFLWPATKYFLDGNVCVNVCVNVCGNVDASLSAT